MSAEEKDLEFIKNYIFTPELSGNFLTMLGKSKDFDLVLTKLFNSFTDDEWLTHKNVIFDFITRTGNASQNTNSYNNRNNSATPILSEQNALKIYKLPINYTVWGPALNAEKWGTYLSTYKNNNFYNRLEPYFLEFAKKQNSSAMALNYYQVKFGANSTHASDLLGVFKECGVEVVPENQWADILQKTFRWTLNEKVKLIEALNIDPTYSADAFVFFLGYKNNESNDAWLQDFSRSSSIGYGRGQKVINLSNLSTTGVAWFTNKITSMTHEEIDTFFENKFNLREKRKFIKSQSAIEETAKKEYRNNSAQIQDYVYLLAFANLILNPSNTSVATQLAVALDPYLSKKMVDTTRPWYKKMQDLIEKEKFRQFLPTPDKSAWAPIYEKVALDKLLASMPVKSENTKPRKNKI